MTYDPATLRATGAATSEDLAARLGALVGSRLCHDLTSPLGAIGNGVELLQMSDAGRAASAEMALIEEALSSARARIRVFRMAFGAAGQGQRVTPAEIAALRDDWQAGGRLKIDLAIEPDQPRAMVQIIALAMMCLESAMPWGGQVQVVQSGRDYTITASAERTRNEPHLWRWLDGAGDGAGELAASDVHFALLGLATRQAGRPLRWTLTQTSAHIAF